MTLRPEYSLGHSAYNDFLYAHVGHDATGTELTVLSALARLGLDPWAEAARLADLPRAAAAQALAAAIARLPDVRLVAAGEAAAVAERLVVSLPAGSAPAIPQTEEAAAAERPSAAGTAATSPTRPSIVPAWTSPRAPAPRAGLATWLLWSSLALALYFLIVQMTPDRQLESQFETPAGTSQQ